MKVTAEDLVKLVRQRYPLNRPNGFQTHVVLEQVPDATGIHQGHWIDVAVFDLWPSKGLTRSAFEIKVSRSDFIRELQHPNKYKWVLEAFHEFWFVAPKDVIQLDELPVNVGWMCPRGNKLVIKRHAVQNPNPKLDDVLLAAFMRAAAKEITRVNSTVAKDILDNSEEYRVAKLFQAAVRTFIKQRGIIKFESTTPTIEEVLSWLDEATMDNQLKQDRDHLLDIAARFQREVMSLLNIFLVIANKSLFARDQLGKYIISAYGGEDEESVETLKEHIKNAKHLDSQKRYVQMIELVLNWEREFPT
jgi:hypothetical protein